MSMANRQVMWMEWQSKTAMRTCDKESQILSDLGTTDRRALLEKPPCANSLYCQHDVSEGWFASSETGYWQVVSDQSAKAN